MMMPNTDLNDKKEPKKISVLNRKRIKWIVITLILVAVIFLISKYLFFIGLVLIINLLFYLLTRRLSSIVGIEITTISTVLIGAAFGPIAGVLVGISCRLIEAFASHRFFSLPLTIPLYAIIGYAAGSFGGSDIAMLGVAISVVYSVISGILTFMVLGGRASRTILFCIVNIFFNVIFFVKIAPVIFSIIT